MLPHLAEALFERAAHGRHIDWDPPNPQGRPIEEVRATRDDIQQRVAGLLAGEAGPLGQSVALP